MTNNNTYDRLSLALGPGRSLLPALDECHVARQIEVPKADRGKVGKVWRLVSRMGPGPGCFLQEVAPAEDEPNLLDLDRAAELFREAGIPCLQLARQRDLRWALQPSILARRIASRPAE